MSVATPNTQEIADSIVAQIEVAIDQAIPLLPKSFTRVLAKVLAAQHLILYKYIGFMFLQRFVDTASFQETTVNGRTVRPLVELGRRFGVRDPALATRAEHTVNVTVVNQTGWLPAGTPLLHAPSGFVHQTTAPVQLNAPTVVVRVVATSDSSGGNGEGAAGNLFAGDALSFANSLPNVARIATVASQLATGADAESEESYRDLVRKRGRARPQGGAYADYQAWAESVPGIRAAFPYTGQPGEIDVYAEATESSSGNADGVPTSGQLAQVLEAILFDEDGRAVRAPAGTAVNVRAITRRSFDVSVVGLVAPDTPAAESAIADALDEYLRTRRPFIVGLSTLPREDRVTAAMLSGIAQEAAEASGGFLTSVSVSVGGVSMFSYTLGVGETAKLGTITF